MVSAGEYVEYQRALACRRISSLTARQRTRSIIVDEAGNVVQGDHTIADNVNTSETTMRSYPQLQRRFDRRSARLYIESSFHADKFPMTETQ